MDNIKKYLEERIDGLIDGMLSVSEMTEILPLGKSIDIYQMEVCVSLRDSFSK